MGELHELVSASMFHSGATTGFALALCSLAPQGSVIFVQRDFAALETGSLYGLGCDAFGISCARLLVVRTSTSREALWAMEEALKTRGVAAVIGETAEDGKSFDLTATRRLSLAAQKGGGLALLLRRNVFGQISSAATRWQVAAARGAGAGFGGLGRTAFTVSLIKNRRGPCGAWVLQWDSHAERFLPALSLAVVAPSRHGSGGTPFVAAN